MSLLFPCQTVSPESIYTSSTHHTSGPQSFSCCNTLIQFFILWGPKRKDLSSNSQNSCKVKHSSTHLQSQSSCGFPVLLWLPSAPVASQCSVASWCSCSIRVLLQFPGAPAVFQCSCTFSVLLRFPMLLWLPSALVATKCSCSFPVLL